MNKKNLNLSGFALFSVVFLNACDDSGECVEPCTDRPNIEANDVQPSLEGSDNGKISVVALGGVSPYQYSLDGSMFQPDPVFSNLTPGNYTITVKDFQDCSGSIAVTVEELPEVSYINEIRPIIDTNCQISGCHGSSPGIPTFATYNTIKANATGIKSRTSARTMPPAGALTDSQIELISN